jgi:signal transduction histidine kinase
LLHECADSSSSPGASRILADLHELTKQASEEIRTFAYLLRPPILEGKSKAPRTLGLAD